MVDGSRQREDLLYYNEGEDEHNRMRDFAAESRGCKSNKP